MTYEVTPEEMQNLYEHDGAEGIAHVVNYWVVRAKIVENIQRMQEERDEARKLAIMFKKMFGEMPAGIEEIFPELEQLPEDHWLWS